MAGDGDKKYNEQLPISHTKLAYASGFEQLLQHITADNLLSQCNGPLEHDQHEWRDFFKTIEPLQSQCLTAGRRLVAVLNEIRNADLQGPPTRRQLHSQHRALCRALMDAELQHLRRRAPNALVQLQEHVKRIRKRTYRRTKTSGDEHKANACLEPAASVESFVEQRLNGLITVFSEIERAAKRLEQLTEQHRERLRELARQRAFEDEINEVRLRGTIKRVNEPQTRFSPSSPHQVIEWINSEGENSLKKYGALSLECGDTVRDEEQDFEKFYFISMVS